MILITTYYESQNTYRQKEIIYCLIKNFKNKYIKTIYLLNNNIYDLYFINDIFKKIKQIKISDNQKYILKYNDALQFINNNLKNEICILANSDIYFDYSLNKINYKNIYNHCFALLRYDEISIEDKKIYTLHNIPRNDSQDSWIFQSPLNIDLNQCNFSFGTLGCDSIFASIIYDSNIKISNPSYDIISTHVHKSDYRTYDETTRIHGKYCLLKPIFLKDIKIESSENPIFMDY
jgi:hypothetical protein